MPYESITDFLTLLRSQGKATRFARMPGLDWWVDALRRSGLIRVVVAATAPTVNRSTTAWFKPSNPSFPKEGLLYLWDAAHNEYRLATPGLFYNMLISAAGEEINVDFTADALLKVLDELFGTAEGTMIVHTGGTWKGLLKGAAGTVLSSGGTSVSWQKLALTSTLFDDLFGSSIGSLIVRGPTGWGPLSPGASGTVLTSAGSNVVPIWGAAGGGGGGGGITPSELNTLLDQLFGTVQGSTIYRGPSVWETLIPGTSGQVLTTQGGGANPKWAPIPVTGQPIPSVPNSWAVGSVLLVNVYNPPLPDPDGIYTKLNNGSSISGSQLGLVYFSGTFDGSGGGGPFVLPMTYNGAVGGLSGTWKNISGTTIYWPVNQGTSGGYFVRTA